MTHSVYHLYCDLLKKKDKFNSVKKLEQIPFDENLLSCRNKGRFPDLAIRLNATNMDFEGGELIEIKESKSYTVSSFNSTIPTGKKSITELISGKSNSIRKQMEFAGDNILDHPIREVYYFIRGRKEKKQKVALVHGKFFETLSISELISQSFLQALEERLLNKKIELQSEVKNILTQLLTDQDIFSKVRSIEKASIRLRFRIMTEVKEEGNLLNPNKYPEILDNTLNFLIPCNLQSEEIKHRQLMSKAFKELNAEKMFKELRIFPINHLLNGPFLVFQAKLK